MKTTWSLRARLTGIILLPLMAVAILAGFWQVENARRTAADVFDRSLLSAALAVANDVTLSGGDALSLQTEAILGDTSGGRVFYHVYAPDGVIVAGYATPPVGIPAVGVAPGEPRYFDGQYQGRTVSGVRLQTRTEIDDFSGIFTTTVWQDATVRAAFVNQLVERSLITIAGLIASVALIVWFGVRIGLRPLLDLQDAIEQRSSEELRAIRRPVPEEVQGIVARLNGLFDQVSRSMSAQNEFISNAAHQLRNPIAGVLSLAEAVKTAPSFDAAMERSADLLDAAKETADLSQKLLTLERAKSLSPVSMHEQIDLTASLRHWQPGFAQAAAPITVTLSLPEGLGLVTADPTMLREALGNLVDNAVRHGGPSLTDIEITAERRPGVVALSVQDNGRGIPAERIDAVQDRFTQLGTGAGSGLGLPIVNAIAEAHGGVLDIATRDRGAQITLELPI